MKQLNACKQCHLLTEENRCPRCDEQTIKRWRGYVVIRDPVRSQIAEKMNVTQPGKYALKVR